MIIDNDKPSTRISFRVFIGETRSQRLYHCTTCKVLKKKINKPQYSNSGSNVISTTHKIYSNNYYQCSNTQATASYFLWSEVRIRHSPSFWFGKSFKFEGSTVQWDFELIGKSVLNHKSLKYLLLANVFSLHTLATINKSHLNLEHICQYK